MKSSIKQSISNLFGITRSVPEQAQTAAASIYQDQAFISTIGYLTHLPDPDLVLRNAGKTRVDLKQLTYDDEIYGALETRRDAVISTPWQLEGGTSARQRKFINSVIEKHIKTILTSAWAAVPFGYSVAECVYAQNADGTIGIEKYEEKPFEWFRPNVDNTLILFSPFQGQQLVDTQFKFFLTRRQSTYINPYGEALLSRLYWPWFFRTNGWRWWSKWLDRHGDPLLLAKAGKPKDLVNALTSMGIENVVAVGKDEEVSVVAPHGTDVFERFDGVISAKIHKLILGQTLTTDNAKGGSNALGQVHNLVRMDKRNSDIGMVSETVQNLINALVLLNPQFGKDAPKFVMQDGLGIEADRANRDATLAKSGIVKFTAAYIERAYDLEIGDFEIPTFDAQVSLAKVNPLTGNQQPGSNIDASSTAAATAVQAAVQHRFAAAEQTFTKDQQAVEAIGSEAITAATNPIDIESIRACVFSASDAADLRSRLAIVMGNADTSAFANTLEKALMAADVLGYRSAAK